MTDPSSQDPTSTASAATFATLKAKAQDVGAKAAQRVDQARLNAAAGLDTVATGVHDSGDRVADAAHNAADAVTRSAEYLRRNDVQAITGDLFGVIRRNPGPALLGAAALGFLLGRAFRRD